MQIEVNGCRLFFDVEGQGLIADGDAMRQRPTVILLHGGPGADHSIHKPAFSVLSEHAQVIYLDHRGNGRSDQSDPKHWTLDQWADDLHAFCVALGIHRPIVLGTSFGGFVAQAYATRYPDHPGGLILVSTAARMDWQHVFAGFERRGGAAARSAAEGYWMHPTSDSRAHYRDICVPLYTVDPSPPDWLRRLIIKDDVALHFNGPANEMGRMDFRADLAKVTCPTLILVGEDDPLTPPEFAQAIASGLPRGIGTLKRIQNAGHGIAGDAPQEFFATVSAFISQTSGPANA